MHRCGTCKYWDVQDATEPNRGYCHSPNILQGTYWPDESTNDMARAGGYEGYGDYFQTEANFGCIHWETK